MDYEKLRRMFNRRAFHPTEICLDDGEKYLVSHPEMILVSETICFWTNGKEWAVFGPEAVSALRPPKGPNGRARRNGGAGRRLLH